MSRARVAIVGTGGIAGICHVPALRGEAARAEVVAAMDVDAGRVKTFCDEHGIPGAFTDLDRLLEEIRPDLVHVCTPPLVHTEQVVACLEAGAWVLCEKPPCLSLAEYDRMAAAEGTGGSGAGVDGAGGGPYAAIVFQHRFGSGAGRMRELMARGELGRPLVAQCVTAWYRDHAYFEVPWRGRWDTEGGGPTMGHGIHQMDLMLALLGEWIEIRAMAGRLDRDVQTEDVSMAMVRFASGAMASVVNSVLSPREESYLRFDFTDATVELRHLYGYRDADWSYTPAPHVPEARAAAWTAPAAGGAADVPSSHAAQLAALLDSYERGERPATSGAGGRQTLEFVTGLYKSALTGRPVLRSELAPGDPFYHRPHGDTPGWAPEVGT
ncbi:Gfo/Idh/MocA family protein [Actinomadura sp. HBU206391]|uniref:Gfo/Idh/MocA family protein n=1 Tax=Actinomadura sp. HBU206391 TaxID=2731692 RepID=UPI00164F8225|nr:Gfo/Idh/MocA family oxidoreductase [Actinomadura sp. HBU206391]MBC6458202.1 Gfo/Idh/MocA family oxidoreductase [Actinomadura sp. HBU206391]